MAQAVAAQALARSSVLLEDPNLGAAAVRAFTSVSPFLLSLPSGPWIRLYGFNGEVVLNAQLQSIVSLLDYATTSGNAAASALAQRLIATAETLFPRFDTGDWSRYELGGGYAPRDYQKFVTDLLAKLAKQTRRSVLGRDGAAVPRVLLRPAAGDAARRRRRRSGPSRSTGTSTSRRSRSRLSMRASVTLAVGGKVATYRLNAGTRTLTWKPPAGLAPGTYPVQVSAVSYAGHRKTFTLAPLVVGWDTAPPPITRDAHRHDAELAGERAGHAVARARDRSRRSRGREPAADARSRPPARPPGRRRSRSRPAPGRRRSGPRTRQG